MTKIKIKKILDTKQVDFNGKSLTKIQFLTEDDIVADTFAKVEVGQEYEGDLTETKYGKQFKKSQGTAFAGNRNDPETRKEIIRQNSLTNSVAYVLGKAQFMSKDEALKFVTGKEIIQVATYFSKFSMGEITVVTESSKPEVTAPNSNEIEEDEEPPIKDDTEDMLSGIPF